MSKFFTKEDSALILEGLELSETVANTFINTLEESLSNKVDKIKTDLEIENIKKLEESLTDQTNKLDNKVENMLDFAIKNWIESNENKIIESVKLESMEKFITGMKTVFNECYIDFPDESIDIIKLREDKINKMESEIGSLIESNNTINKELQSVKKLSNIDKFISTSNLTESQVEQFTKFADKVDYSDTTELNSKLSLLKERYFGSHDETSDMDTQTNIKKPVNNIDKLAKSLI